MSENESLASNVTTLEIEDKVLDEYWDVRDKYEAVFGKLSFADSVSPGPLPDKIKAMTDKLNAYYRQQRRAEKRKPALAAV